MRRKGASLCSRVSPLSPELFKKVRTPTAASTVFVFCVCIWGRFLSFPSPNIFSCWFCFSGVLALWSSLCLYRPFHIFSFTNTTAVSADSTKRPERLVFATRWQCNTIHACNKKGMGLWDFGYVLLTKLAPDLRSNFL